MRYCVLFPKTKNVHLIKDVGMIAYKMHELYGYEASIACYNNDTYDYIKSDVEGLNLTFIKKKYKNEILDGMRFLKENSRNIDVLQIFHVTLSSVLYTFQYKYSNPKGKIFLKLDCTDKLLDKILNLKGIEKKVFNFLFNNADVIGVEQKRLYKKLSEIIGDNSVKLMVISNGIDYEKVKIGVISEKENIVLNVGRIGSPEKRIESLIEIFNDITQKEFKNWKLVLIGPVEETILDKIPKLKKNIIIKGSIYDRNALFKEFSKAKIYCCTSLYESFGISILEASAAGNFVVSTDVGIASELEEEGIGITKGINDLEGLKDSLKSCMKEDLSETQAKAIAYCRKEHDWNKIVESLNCKLKGDKIEKLS